jgi:hypothetical protein
MTTITLKIETEKNVPADVLIEHIAVALKKLIPAKEAKPDFTVTLVGSKTHPFDGPELFDDVRSVPYDLFASGGVLTGNGPLAGEVHKGDYIIPKSAISEGLPRLQELFDAKRADRELKRPIEGPTEPLSEGDWDLDADTAGED